MITLLTALERYYDAVPRSAARVEDFGPLTLFVREGAGWPYYARPALGWTGAPVTAEDVTLVRDRQRELGAPEAFEWVDETTPALRPAIAVAGLEIHGHPLMVLGGFERPAPTGASVRILGADDPIIPAALAAQHSAFGANVSASELAANGTVARMAERIAGGLTVLAVASDADGTPLCVGQHQPVGDTSEIVGLGTVPAARRQGFGLAVTAALAEDALARGARTVFLSATDDSVARLYARLGFQRVGTALIAESPAGS